MQNLQPLTDNIVRFDKKVYILDAIFRSIIDSNLSNHVAIKEESSNYLVFFDELVILQKKQEFIGNVNVQMVKIKLEKKFEGIRKTIVERAISVNKTSL